LNMNANGGFNIVLFTHSNFMVKAFKVPKAVVGNNAVFQATLTLSAGIWGLDDAPAQPPNRNIQLFGLPNMKKHVQKMDPLQRNKLCPWERSSGCPRVKSNLADGCAGDAGVRLPTECLWQSPPAVAAPACGLGVANALHCAVVTDMVVADPSKPTVAPPPGFVITRITTRAAAVAAVNPMCQPFAVLVAGPAGADSGGVAGDDFGDDGEDEDRRPNQE
jgi:hypothetical protein